MRLTALVDCPKCGSTYDGEWLDESADTIQDMDGPPAGLLQCPECGHAHEETWPGWAFYTDAG